MALCGSRVGVVEATQDGDGPHAATAPCRSRAFRGYSRDPLCQTLVRPVVVEVLHVVAEDAPQLGRAQDQEVSQALPPHAAEKARAHRVLSRCPIRRPQDRDAARCRDAGAGRPVRGVVIADAEARAPVERGGLAQLLGDPGVGRVARHADVHHASCIEGDGDEGVERAEEQVGDREEIAGPDVGGVVAQERRPRLPAATRWAGFAQGALEGRRGAADGELQELAPDALRAPCQ